MTWPNPDTLLADLIDASSSDLVDLVGMVIAELDRRGVRLARAARRSPRLWWWSLDAGLLAELHPAGQALWTARLFAHGSSRPAGSAAQGEAAVSPPMSYDDAVRWVADALAELGFVVVP